MAEAEAEGPMAGAVVRARHAGELTALLDFLTPRVPAHRTPLGGARTGPRPTAAERLRLDLLPTRRRPALWGGAGVQLLKWGVGNVNQHDLAVALSGRQQGLPTHVYAFNLPPPPARRDLALISP